MTHDPKEGDLAVDLMTGTLGHVTDLSKMADNNPTLGVSIGYNAMTQKALSKKTHDFSKEQSGAKKYFPLKTVAHNLGITNRTLQRLITSVVVKMDSSRESSKKLNPKLDLGLNFVSGKGYRVVPEMARCFISGHHREMNMYTFLEGIEFTQEAVNILTQLKSEYPDFIRSIDHFKDRRVDIPV